jgi:hypothetical protein
MSRFPLSLNNGVALKINYKFLERQATADTKPIMLPTAVHGIGARRLPENDTHPGQLTLDLGQNDLHPCQRTLDRPDSQQLAGFEGPQPGLKCRFVQRQSHRGFMDR